MHPVVNDWLAAINAQSRDCLTALLAEKHVFFVDGEEPLTGRHKVLAAWDDYFAAFPDYKIFVDECYEFGSTVFVVGHTAGSHVPTALEAVKSSVIWMCKVDGGEVKEWSIYEGNAFNRKKFNLPLVSTE